jgi:hypothetical protein
MLRPAWLMNGLNGWHSASPSNSLNPRPFSSWLPCQSLNPEITSVSPDLPPLLRLVGRKIEAELVGSASLKSVDLVYGRLTEGQSSRTTENGEAEILFWHGLLLNSGLVFLFHPVSKCKTCVFIILIFSRRVAAGNCNSGYLFIYFYMM